MDEKTKYNAHFSAKAGKKKFRLVGNECFKQINTICRQMVLLIGENPDDCILTNSKQGQNVTKKNAKIAYHDPETGTTHTEKFIDFILNRLIQKRINILKGEFNLL